METPQATTMTTGAPVTSPRKTFFYAIVEKRTDHSERPETTIVEADSRTDLKKKLAARGPDFKVMAVIRGRKIKVSTTVALSFI